MRRSPVIAVIACGALAAGCGGGGAPSSSTSSKVAVTTTSSTSSAALTTPAATTTTTQTQTPPHRRHSHRRRPATATGPTGPTGFTALPSSGTPTPSPPDRALQIAACKRMVANDTSTALTVAEARVLDQLCGLYGSKDPSKVAAAKLQICLLVVKDSGLPSAAAKAERESCRVSQGS
jgi:hypothetical protein